MESSGLAEALAKAQGDIKNPPYDSINPHFKSRYASLAAIRDAVTPALSKNGLAITQIPLNLEAGQVGVKTVLRHGSGEVISFDFHVPVQKQDPHGYGSALTYARRYSLLSLFCVAGDEDDDGNAAVKPDTHKTTPTEPGNGNNGDNKAKLQTLRERFSEYSAKHGLDKSMKVVQSITGPLTRKSADIQPKHYDAVIAALTLEAAQPEAQS